MNNTSNTTHVIDADDFFSTFEKELTEPIPGEEFDVLPKDESLSWEVGFSKFCRRLKRRQASKARYKK